MHIYIHMSYQLLQKSLEELGRVILQLDRLMHAYIGACIHEVHAVKRTQLTVLQELHHAL
jgi:hypothetical protein